MVLAWPINPSYSLDYNVWFSDGHLPQVRPVRASDSSGMSLGIIGKEKLFFSPGLEISSMYCFQSAVAGSHFAISSSLSS